MTRFAPLPLALGLLLAAHGAQAADVLVVLSDADHLDLRDGGRFSTGFYLNELMQPVKRLREAGHTVVFATPEGRAPSLDTTSVDAQYFGGDAAALREHQQLLLQLQLTDPRHSPVLSLARVEQQGLGRFAAVYIPGGHAPMQDLLDSPSVGRVLRYFHDNAKPTALVCHGPIALLSTLPDARGFTTTLKTGGTPAAVQDWIYRGYRMTVISNAEEEQAKGLLNGGQMQFYPQTALQAAGGSYRSNAAPWQPNVVIDRELITGQNPASAMAVADALLQRLH
ncbi:type 1 glutamine amidotransferase domain-containing protein [Stenotrophomonas sp. 24(2023)]|uniref:type 1 glutamine amidotransferase domain-containing protein n=1 Tax=Stenotrophomonas sp. 24(2023) TaxID=3068324 RepID=UPI0027E16EC6|nr:type 1 glutamine amidotransferase domain-containing protein [Stenotrophomonas sp. 24(2023)]WMJ68265.1 type 1 glutamine amidotransferase domain-containing protein [Stenotrophomonas sp. 24(2023)]